MTGVVIGSAYALGGGRPSLVAIEGTEIGERSTHSGDVYSVQRLPGEFTGYANLTISGLVTGSDVVILEAGTTTEKVNVDSNAGASYVYNYGHSGSSPGNVDICIYKAGYVPFFVRNYALQITDALLPVAQITDRGYNNPA